VKRFSGTISGIKSVASKLLTFTIYTNQKNHATIKCGDKPKIPLSED